MSNTPRTSRESAPDGSRADLLIRWRGRQEGPYTAAVIEAKLAANQIGLLHEVFHNGQWVTLRDYFTERDSLLRAERQAREEEERRTREEAERQLKEKEEQRRLDLLAEERRKAAQAEHDNLRHSQVTTQFPQPANTSPASSGLRTFGILLFIAGLAVVTYFFLVFDPSVESGIGRVNNLGLMADRQNGIIVGIGLGVVGGIMLAVGARGKN
jgi:hypothetical protein